MQFYFYVSISSNQISNIACNNITLEQIVITFFAKYQNDQTT
jgi:hypothetical protein